MDFRIDNIEELEMTISSTEHSELVGHIAINNEVFVEEDTFC